MPDCKYVGKRQYGTYPGFNSPHVTALTWQDLFEINLEWP